MNTLNDIISVDELKSDLKVKRMTEKDHIRSLAFTMVNTVDPIFIEEDKLIKVAQDMGFQLVKVNSENLNTNFTISFTDPKPNSEAYKIMEEVNEFKNDIINKVNNEIKLHKEIYDGSKTITIILNLEEFLRKYKVIPLYNDRYSLKWLSDKVTKAGYCCNNLLNLGSQLCSSRMIAYELWIIWN